MPVTLKDIAADVGVSPQVVASVLTGRGKARSSPETRARVLEVAQRLGYRANASARSLATGKTFNIELQVHTRGDSLFRLPLHYLPFWAAVAQTCQEKHYNCILTSRTNDDESLLLRNLQQRNVDGVITLAMHRFDVQELAQAEKVPLVCVNPMVPGTQVQAQGCPVVNFDNAGGVQTAVDYLVQRGHQKIGYVRGQAQHTDFSERFAAFVEAMNRCGLSVNPAWVWEDVPRLEGGERVGQALFAQRDRPTAVLTGNDNLALGILRTLLGAGVSVPGELSLFGFDDVDAARIVYPGLTTIRLDWQELGRIATEHLLSVLSKPPEERQFLTEIRTPVTLIERHSVQSMPSSSHQALQ